MKVLKFGGSSVGNAEKIRNVISIIAKSQKENKKIAVVVSALQGVTDELIKISLMASNRDETYKDNLSKLEVLHLTAVKDLINVKSQSSKLANLKITFNELKDLLHGVFLLKELSAKTLDLILSFGERLSAFIITSALINEGINADFSDSRTIIKTDDNFGGARINFQLTNENIKNHFRKNKNLQIITGFIASTVNNETTTLGRGGSDYTASVIGAALDADEIEIWTDVDGVMTADPRKVKKAFSIQCVTYEEAMELSHFGAKVIHPPTLQPALDKKIPLRIKNTFNPSFEGTVVGIKSDFKNFSIKGISSIDDVALLRVQGSGMVGVAGVAQRIFGALASKNISIILISQASSEHSICFAVLPRFASSAKKAIEEELKYEIKEKIVNEVIVESNLSVIAVVGENMRNTPGISGRVFQALGKNGINISAIAQGSSELNISAVVAKENEAKSLNALHDAFFLSIAKTVHLYLVGSGLIGGTLLKQILNQKDFLAKEYHLNIKLIGLANSRKMIFNKNGIDISHWEKDLFKNGEKTDLLSFINEMKKLNMPNSIFVDCTASEEVICSYKEILDSSISIVTPNKKANSREYNYYQQLKDSALKHNVKFLYETNVGAGLPIIGTIKDLVSSGDKIVKIEGVLSGTLSYIFNSYTNGKAFSEIVKEAKERGYTEPDPREDLNGLDVARKLLILAREAGIEMELKDIKVENLVPESARNSKSVDEFFMKLKKHDAEFEKRKKDAEKEGKVLRYVARLENAKAEISLQKVDRDHPFYSLSGSDNIFAFTTLHYQDRPVVVKGPGAGADVTSAGVFADVIRISNYLS